MHIKCFITTKQTGCTKFFQVLPKFFPNLYTYERFYLVWCLRLIMEESSAIFLRVFVSLKRIINGSIWFFCNRRMVKFICVSKHRFVMPILFWGVIKNRWKRCPRARFCSVKWQKIVFYEIAFAKSKFIFISRICCRSLKFWNSNGYEIKTNIDQLWV